MRLFRRPRGWMMAPLVALGLMITPTSPSDAATLQPTALGSISGRVVNSRGAPVADAYVDVTINAGTLQVHTNANGYYRASLLPAGSHIVSFTPPIGSTYASSYYKNAVHENEATPVVLASGENRANINGVLPDEAVITGKIFDAASKPVANATIYAYPNGGGVWDFFNTTSDATGKYRIDGLKAGTYTLRFDGPEGANYVKPTPLERTLVAGQTLTKNIQLATGVTFGGRVTNTSGLPVKAVVHAYQNGAAQRSVANDANGNYTVKGLKPGAYDIFVAVPANSAYLSQWSTITIAPGQNPTGINVTLVRGASISGKVTSASGQPSVGASVDYCQSGAGFCVHATSNANGLYSFKGLEAGTYTLYYTAPGKTNYEPSLTTDITLTQSQTRINVNATFPAQ